MPAKTSLTISASLDSVLCILAGVTLLASSTVSAIPAEATDSPRERISFNADWRFQKDDPADAEGKLAYPKIKEWVTATGGEFSTREEVTRQPPASDPGSDVAYTTPGFDDSGWRKLNLPHDWGIEGPFKQEYAGETGKLPYWGIGWYRKHFAVSAQDEGRRISLDIDGAMSYAAVWCNGHFVGGWPYGYTSFQLDLTPYLKSGTDNVLAIRLDNPSESSRWYPGGGIYRNVWLVKTGPVHVAHWGTFVTTAEVAESTAVVELKVRVDNDSAAAAEVTLRTEIYAIAADGKLEATPAAASEPQHVTVSAGKQAAETARIRVKNPKLWSPEAPNLYAAVTRVEQEGKPADRYQTVFGIRTIRFDADHGFFLNDKPVEIYGVCNHHDLGPLGSAVSSRALARQIELLKEMGCNAIRTSHNPPAPELLDLCDRMGMLVMDEAFDCWRQGKKRNDYHNVFNEWHEKDLRALVRRDRNHSCVILWSIGNEVKEQGSGAGAELSAKLAAIAREEDTSRPVAAGCNVLQAGYNGFQKTVDVFGYNYKPFEYGKFHQANPGIPLFGSETSSCISSRGEYFFPVSENKAEGQSNFQMSSYDLYAPRWATIPDAEFKGQDEFPFVAGEFVWTGFDYLGEPTPYNSDTSNVLNFSDPAEQERARKELEELGKIKVPSRSSYFGIIDLCGFPKDRFYLYQARWRPELPMAHILPHWNWPERIGEVTPVHVYTSGDEAELFLNGNSLGRRKKEQHQYRLRWDEVKYEPGELKVVAYKSGKSWAEEIVQTTGPAEKVTLKADRKVINSDGEDLSFVTVSVADKEGRVVPRSRNMIRFEISDPGEIAGIDNGDATSHVSFQAREHAAFNGLCLVIVRSKAGQPGAITLKAESEGLQSAEVSITAQ